jgi:hypothetical protein
VASNDRREVRLSVAPMISRSSQAIAAAPLKDASLPEPQNESQRSSTVTANVPVGSTLLVNGGELAGANDNGKSASQRLLIVVTPRILVAEEEEELLDAVPDSY